MYVHGKSWYQCLVSLSLSPEIRMIVGLFLNVSHEYLWSYNFKSLEIFVCLCLCVHIYKYTMPTYVHAYTLTPYPHHTHTHTHTHFYSSESKCPEHTFTRQSPSVRNTLLLVRVQVSGTRHPNSVPTPWFCSRQQRVCVRQVSLHLCSHTPVHRHLPIWLIHDPMFTGGVFVLSRVSPRIEVRQVSGASEVRVTRTSKKVNENWLLFKKL
jgi:hypothetical protein